MKEKILKLITAISVIIVLTSINVLFLGYHIVIALANELETQGNNTNITDVQFDAYFKVDNGNTHYRQANITDDQIYLYININVLEKGSVNNAKIKINDSNFKIKENNNLNANTYVKNIDLNTNEIELNSIIYNNSVEIEIPIEFNKIDNINSNYFSKETNITLEGIYKEEEDEKALEGKIITKLDWTDNAEVTMFQTIEKCIDLGEKGILLQQGITTTIENGSLPRETEKFNIAVPKIGDILPTSIDVLINGTKIDGSRIQYNEENGQLFVEKEIAIDNEGNCSWDSGKDEYKIIYMYDQSVRDNLTNVTLHTEMNSKLFTKENMTKTDEQEVGLEFIGNVVSVKKFATEELYKGYLYANSTNETTYREDNVIEISNAEIIDSINASTSNSYFANEEQTAYDANAIVLYKETLINKNLFLQLFGEEGYMNIKDVNGNIITTINNQSETDESGNIHITYEQSITGIIFETSKPLEEGQFTIHNVKAIQGNTGYTKNQLKTFTRLQTNEIVVTNLGTDTVETGINLLDTKTEAKLELSTTNFSTLQMNENVQLLAILKSDSAEYDLYKNPFIEIRLPQELEQIDIYSINLLYGDGLQIVRQAYSQSEKIIQIQLEGEQSAFRNSIEEGIQIAISANMTFRKNIPTTETAITMIYRNENADQAQYETSVDIKLNSKYGAYLYNNISGYNEENTSLETIDNNTLMAKLDTETNEKQATVQQSFINNYSIPINQVAIVGNLKAENSNFDTALAQNIVTNREDAKIYYSTEENVSADDESWQENVESLEGMKAYKIELNGELQPAETINMDYQLVIPTQLEAGVTNYNKTDITYSYNGQALSTSSTIQLFTEQEPTIDVTTDAGISAQITATTANGQEVADGTEIFEGQPVEYTVTLENNTGRDLTNIQLVADHTNAVYYVQTERDPVTADYPELEDKIIITEKDENAENITRQLSELKNGETVTFTYLISPKRIDGNEMTGHITVTADSLETQEINTITNIIKDATIAVEVINNVDENFVPTVGDVISFKFNVTNYLPENQENVKLTIYTSELLSCIDEPEYIQEQLGFEASYENDALVLNIPTLSANETTSFNITFVFGEIPEDMVNTNVTLYCVAQENNGNIYYSNTIERQVDRTIAKIEATQSSNAEGNVVKAGDTITYMAEITNVDTAIDADDLQIVQYLEAKNAQIKNAYLETSNGQIVDAIVLSETEARFEYDLKQGETVQYVAEVTVSEEQVLDEDYDHQIVSYMSLAWNMGGTLDLNPIVTEVVDNTTTPGDNDDNNDDNNNDNNGDNNNDEADDNFISGTAWLDSNKDGTKGDNESGIADIEIHLMNAQTEEIIKTARTNSEGFYQFDHLNEGNYIVIFNYDSSKYRTTQYKKDGVDETRNSDVIQKEVNGKISTITDTLTIHNGGLSNINAGFIENEIFDISLNKTISKVIVQNAQGTRQITYNKEKLAKVEIRSKYIENTTVLVEYNIEIKNEGELQGYVNEIVDYIPSDLQFSSEINKDWYIGSDGNLHNNSLLNNVINPGETKTITLTLTKQMTAENTGNSINTAEIAETSNDFSVVDTDSIPNNKKDGEDDISSAELIISVGTGAVVVSISIIVILIIVGVVFVIYKKKERGGKLDENNQNKIG